MVVLPVVLILVSFGLFFNPKPIIDYSIDVVGYDEEEIQETLSTMSASEQTEYIKNLQSLSGRMLLKVDDNEYIGDLMLQEQPENLDGVYISFTSTSDNAEKIRKLIKKYHKKNKEYHIIYTNVESSMVIGNTIYYQVLSDENSPFEGASRFPAVFIVKDGEIVYETFDYAELKNLHKIWEGYN